MFGTSCLVTLYIWYNLPQIPYQICLTTNECSTELLLRRLVQQRRFYTRDGIILGGVHQKKWEIHKYTVCPICLWTGLGRLQFWVFALTDGNLAEAAGHDGGTTLSNSTQPRSTSRWDTLFCPYFCSYQRFLYPDFSTATTTEVFTTEVIPSADLTGSKWNKYVYRYGQKGLS